MDVGCNHSSSNGDTLLAHDEMQFEAIIVRLMRCTLNKDWLNLLIILSKFTPKYPAWLVKRYWHVIDYQYLIFLLNLFAHLVITAYHIFWLKTFNYILNNMKRSFQVISNQTKLIQKVKVNFTDNLFTTSFATPTQ
jgi:hypothetical protein